MIAACQLLRSISPNSAIALPCLGCAAREECPIACDAKLPGGTPMVAVDEPSM